MGRSAACREALRPLALSMLAELIHHVRTQLKYPQLVTIINTFSRCAQPSPVIYVDERTRSRYIIRTSSDNIIAFSMVLAKHVSVSRLDAVHRFGAMLCST